jgi:hypothetical protein
MTGVKIMKLLVLCKSHQPPVTSFLLGPNILLNTLFSNTLNMRDQVSHQYKTTYKIIVFYILILKLQTEHGRIEDFKPNGSEHSR